MLLSDFSCDQHSHSHFALNLVFRKDKIGRNFCFLNLVFIKDKIYVEIFSKWLRQIARSTLILSFVKTSSMNLVFIKDKIGVNLVFTKKKKTLYIFQINF